MHNVTIITYKNVVTNLKRKKRHAFAELLERGSEKLIPVLC
jgi:hypothetical protein